MPVVLWGVRCISLPGPATAAEVAHEFREAMALSARPGPTPALPPRIDLYRLVPLSTNCYLTGEERVVAEVPDSRITCEEIEDLYRQLDEAEVRFDRAREALLAVAGGPGGADSLASSPGARCRSPAVYEPEEQFADYPIEELRPTTHASFGRTPRVRRRSHQGMRKAGAAVQGERQDVDLILETHNIPRAHDRTAPIWKMYAACKGVKQDSSPPADAGARERHSYGRSRDEMRERTQLLFGGDAPPG
mmetsp:Transcript_54550/g.153521  ORF Transcript_54550/g.153521 Transcript_54550/m.153521 type:complete len:248 (+) Transcript_54550:67-810(+)